MQRRPVWMFKTQGAAGLLASAIGVLITLSVPASVQNFSDGAGASLEPRSSAASFEPFQSSAAERTVPTVPALASSLGSRSFHSVDQTTPPDSLSGGALGMVLLGLFSLALFIAALLVRGPQSHKDR